MERVSHGVQRTSAIQNTAEYQNSINTTTAPSPHYNDVFARVEFTNTIIVKVPTVYGSEYGVVIAKGVQPYTYCLASCLSQLHLTTKCYNSEHMNFQQSKKLTFSQKKPQYCH